MTLDSTSTNITSHFYTYVRDTCRFSNDSDASAVIHLRNPRSGGPADLPYSFLRTRVDHWTFFSIYTCLAHMYMEKQGWTHFTTLFTPIDAYREFRHTD